MKLLFVVDLSHGHKSFSEAMTAALGVSLFAQPTGILFTGKATEALSNTNFEQLQQILELGLTNLYADSRSKHCLNSQQGIQIIDSANIGDIIGNAEAIASF